MLVDLDTMTVTNQEPKYSSNREEWINLAYRPFLDASRSSKFYVSSCQISIQCMQTIPSSNPGKQSKPGREAEVSIMPVVPENSHPVHWGSH